MEKKLVIKISEKLRLDMIQGFNKANLNESKEWIKYSEYDSSVRNRKCVFLSHKNEDKSACRKIAEYLKTAQIDYYLDEEDKKLQSAASVDDSYEITESIKRGIRKSTHMLCIISEKTYQSNWVPFEIGYGHAAIIDKARIENEREEKIKLSILTLNDLSERELPDYMKVGHQIKGIKTLNIYLASLAGKSKAQMINESRIKLNDTIHPLKNILNWQK